MNTRRPIFTFFAVVFAAYFIFSAGYTDTADVEPSIETARAIWERGTLAVSPSRPNVSEFLYTKGKDGEYFSKMGLLYPLLYVPAVGIAKVIARGHNETRWINFLVSFVNPVLAAATVALVFAFFIRGASPPRRAVWIAGALAFATLWFPYSKSAAREILQGLLLVMAFYGARYSILLLGISLVLAPFAKETLLLAMLPAVILAARERTSRHRLIKWLLGASVAALAAFVGYWSFQTGQLRVTGYGANIWGWCRNTPPWSTGFWQGLYQQWIGPERGMLWLSPLVLLPLGWLAMKAAKRKLTGWDAALGAAILFTSVVHAKWFAPCGEQDLGCRYLIPTLPLFALCLADLPAKIPKAICFILALAWLQQIPNVLVKPQQFWTAQQLAGEPLPISHSQANLYFLRHKIAGKPEIYSLRDLGTATAREINLDPFRSFQGLNLWWLHAMRYRKNPVEAPNFR